MSARGGYLALGRVLAAQPGASYAVDLRSNPRWIPISVRRWPVDAAVARGRLWKQTALPQPPTAHLGISDEPGDSHSDHRPCDEAFSSRKRRTQDRLAATPCLVRRSTVR